MRGTCNFSFLASIEPVTTPISIAENREVKATSALKSAMSSLMARRWTKDFFDKLPPVDQVAISRGSSNLQHAAEYSQSAYNCMLKNESKLGNYFRLPSCQFSEMEKNGARQTIVLLIEEISSIKGYKELTLYLAVNIADKYLAELAKQGLAAPPIVTLGVVSLLLAVKMNEPISPNLSNMVHLITSKQAI